ncbi:MAG TPA: cytochrome c [Sphingobacteriaceae bacterium]
MRTKLIAAIFCISCLVILLYSCQSEQELTYARYYVNGKGVYENHCQSCHGKDGNGLKALYPPLTDTTFLRKNKNKIACMIKYGIKGKMIVNGKEYEGEMPAETHLSDIEIAALITYITNSFGNKQGLYEADDATRDIKKCD